jgi:cation:H+ antiporter
VPGALRVLVFVAGAAVSVGTSWLLVVRLERIGKRLGFSEALLGMVAALAADAPEITTAVTALLDHTRSVGAGVILGSNGFNIAALLGLSAVFAGYIALHRRVIVMNGAVAGWVSLACVLTVLGVIGVLVGLVLALAALVPYLALLGGMFRWLPRRWSGWLATAVGEEELELEEVIHPDAGGVRDAGVAALALAVVVGASVAMEQEATALGSSWHVAAILVGALVLAAVTSLPNAVAGIYLALRGRGAASLSTALNSNVLNVVAGLLLPGAILGLGAPNTPTDLIALGYLTLTVLALLAAYAGRGLERRAGAVLIATYGAFTIALIAST